MDIFKYFNNLNRNLEEVLKEIETEEEKNFYKEMFLILPKTNNTFGEYNKEIFNECCRIAIDPEYDFKITKGLNKEKLYFYKNVSNFIMKSYYKKFGIIGE